MIHKNEANRRRIKRLKSAKREKIAKLRYIRAKFLSEYASEQDKNKISNIRGYLSKHGSLSKFSYIGDNTDFSKDNFKKPSEQRRIDNMDQAEKEYKDGR